MATQANSTLIDKAQTLGVTAVAKMVRGSPTIVYRITIPEQTSSNVVDLRRSTLAAFITAAIDAMDIADGEADAEDDDPPESDGCDEDAAWVEWTSMRGPSKRSPNFSLGCEDAEEDDPQGETTEDDPAFDDQSRAIANLKGIGAGPGCIISDDDRDDYS